jgi:hypothetical protein
MRSTLCAPHKPPAPPICVHVADRPPLSPQLAHRAARASYSRARTAAAPPPPSDPGCLRTPAPPVPTPVSPLQRPCAPPRPPSFSPRPTAPLPLTPPHPPSPSLPTGRSLGPPPAFPAPSTSPDGCMVEVRATTTYATPQAARLDDTHPHPPCPQAVASARPQPFQHHQPAQTDVW